jgi:hypothetical protein
VKIAQKTPWQLRSLFILALKQLWLKIEFTHNGAYDLKSRHGWNRFQTSSRISLLAYISCDLLIPEHFVHEFRFNCWLLVCRRDLWKTIKALFVGFLWSIDVVEEQSRSRKIRKSQWSPIITPINHEKFEIDMEKSWSFQHFSSHALLFIILMGSSHVKLLWEQIVVIASGFGEFKCNLESIWNWEIFYCLDGNWRCCHKEELEVFKLMGGGKRFLQFQQNFDVDLQEIETFGIREKSSLR